MKKITLLFTLLIASTGFSQVINEIDADQTGTDSAEFIELLWTPNTPLDGLVLVLFNGSDDQSYAAYDLDTFTTDANGLFVIGNTGVTNAEIILPSNGLQNGADAVALFTGDDTDFPNDTPLTTTGLISAIVYGTNDGDDTALLSGLNETIQYNDTETESIQRQTDGSFLNAAPTPGADNTTQVCNLNIGQISTTCDDITSGQDTYTTTIEFTGGGNDTFNVSSDEGSIDLSNGDPTTDATGVIVITGVPEGTDFNVNITNSGVCDIDTNVFSPDCQPSLNLPFYEAFDYSLGEDLASQTNWTNFSGSGNLLEVIDDNLSYPEINMSTGNAVQLVGGGDDVEIEFEEVTSGEVYASFMIKVNDLSDMTDLTDGGYFALFGNFDARLWIRPDTDPVGTTYDIAYTNSSSGSGFTSTKYNVNDVLLVVMSYNLDDGTLNAWINPESSSFGSTPPQVTLTDVDGSPSSGISRFALRQDSSGETPDITFDELRLGTTYASVTPTTLSTDNFNTDSITLYPNPVTRGNVTIETSSNTPVTIQFYNMLGQQVLTSKATKNINVSNLSAGVYLVKINQNSSSVTKKIIIK
jgi:hypothetical protein